jgi:putrescine transport system permease protein
LAFLYLPIASLIVYSFNASRLVTVWDAVHSPTLKWYGELFHNAQLLEAAWLSLRIAVMNATGAMILGTLAGVALARFGPFRGRGLLAALTTAPLVMPEIITGLSLLLLFITLEQLIGWPARRNAATITLAHISFSISYVAVIVQARLAGFDGSLEEAALDLGARPSEVFRRITLPLIAPALLSGWLLSFTLSWDDVVISQFVAGPGSSTLPMVIFAKVRLGVSPDVNALATLLITIVAAGVLISTLLVQRRERSRARTLALTQET